MPLEPTREQQGAWLCVNSPHDLERVKGAFDINAFAFGGYGGFPPIKKVLSIFPLFLLLRFSKLSKINKME